MEYQKIFDQHLKKIRKFPELDFFLRNQTRYLILLLACVDYNSEKKIITYTIGEEEEKDEEKKDEEETKENKEDEKYPVPVLEEPVIETLSSVVVPVSTLLPSIVEEQSKEDDVHQDSIEEVEQLHEVKKKKRRMKGVRK